jgi:hypothetical protein
MIGVGAGRSYEEATSIARAELIQQLSVTVTADTEVIYTAIETESSAQMTEVINQYIRNTAEHQVAGMEVRHQIHERGRYYVMVVLNRARMLGSMEIELNEMVGSIENSMRSARDFVANAQVVLALNNYSLVYNQLSEFLSKRYLFNNLSNRPFQSRNIISMNELTEQVKILVNNISFEIVSGNNQTVQPNRTLASPIVFRALFNNRGNRIGINNLPIMTIVSYPGIIETRSGATSASGEHSLSPTVNANVGDRGSVMIQIDTTRFPEYFSNMLNDIYAEANFTVVDAPPIHVRLSVTDFNGATIQNVHTEIARILTNNRIHQIANAPLFLRTRAYITNSRIVQRNGNVYLVDVNFEVEFGIVATNEIVGTMRMTESGQSTRGENDAFLQACRNVIINEQELVNMIRRGAER